MSDLRRNIEHISYYIVLYAIYFPQSRQLSSIVQSAGAVEYTGCFSAEE